MARIMGGSPPLVAHTLPPDHWQSVRASLTSVRFRVLTEMIQSLVAISRYLFLCSSLRGIQFKFI